MPLVHFLRHDRYYACISAVGNEIKGLVTRNWKLVTCKNCQKVRGRYRATER